MSADYTKYIKPGSRVLIIDDEVDMCLLMKAYFLRKGCTVYVTHMPEDGLLTAGEHQPDFIFIEPRWLSIMDELRDKMLVLVPGIKMIVCYREIIYRSPELTPPSFLTQFREWWRATGEELRKLKNK